MPPAYSERENSIVFSQLSVALGIMHYTDAIFSAGPNEGHFLKAHSVVLRPCRVPGYVFVKQCRKEEDFGED